MPITVPRVRATLDEVHRPTSYALKDRADDYAAAAGDVLGIRPEALPTSEAGLASALMQHALDQVSARVEQLARDRAFSKRLNDYAHIADFEQRGGESDGGRVTDRDFQVVPAVRRLESGEADDYACPASTNT